MTVEELITALSGWNDDLEVKCYSDGMNALEVASVEFKEDDGEYILVI